MPLAHVLLFGPFLETSVSLIGGGIFLSQLAPDTHDISILLLNTVAENVAILQTSRVACMQGAENFGLKLPVKHGTKKSKSKITEVLPQRNISNLASTRH